MKKIYALILAVITVQTAFSQDYAFKVLANKGTNELKSGNNWAPLKTGASLKIEDELKIADNAYLGLVHVSGKPVEIKQAGTYKISDLSAKVNGGSSVLMKYTDFILSSNGAETKKNRLSATGAVHRDVTGAHAIKLVLPENQHAGIYNSKVVINWDDTKAKGPFVVTLRNMFDDVLHKIETPSSGVEIDLNDPKYSSENAVLVEVTSKADPKQFSKQHLIKKLAAGEQERIKKSLNEISAEVTETTALNKFILAGFYEENNLFIDAIAAYQEAIKLAPDVPSYQEAYNEFLLRHGLKRD